MQTPCVWYMHVQIILTHSQLGCKDRGAMDEVESIKTAEDFPRGVSRALFCTVSLFFLGNFRRKWFSENFLRIYFWVNFPEKNDFKNIKTTKGKWLIVYIYICIYMHVCMMMLGFMELSGAEASLAAAGCFAGSLECLGAPGPRQPSLVRGKVDGARGGMGSHQLRKFILSWLQVENVEIGSCWGWDILSQNNQKPNGKLHKSRSITLLWTWVCGPKKFQTMGIWTTRLLTWSGPGMSMNEMTILNTLVICFLSQSWHAG